MEKLEFMDCHQEFIGKTLGKCRIVEPLKMGGQGCSFIGRDDEVQKDRVIKISRLSLEAFSEEEKAQIENLKREGFILARLRHPQIVDIIEQGEAYGYRYLIVDRIQGQDFNRVLRLLKEKQKELQCDWGKLVHPVTALAIIMSALEPLAYAHQVKIQLPGEGVVEGLAHRDISAGNLLLGMGHEYGGMVHMIDFGIAKTNFHQSMTVNTKIIGTIRYMSPMRLMKPKTGDKKSRYWKDFKQTQHDVHSMGCFLYELLTGETHVNFNDVQQSLAAICNPQTYQDLYKKNRIFHKKIQEIFRRSILFPNDDLGEPAQYKTAGEMLEAVRQVFNSLAGGKDPKEIIKQFTHYIEDPDRIVRTVNEQTSIIIQYDAPMHVYRRAKLNTVTKAAWTLLMLGVATVSAMASLLILPGKLSEPKQPEPLTLPEEKASAAEASAVSTEKAALKSGFRRPARSKDRGVFAEAQMLMRRRNHEADRRAYQLINEYVRDNTHNVDPAFYILKADLIKRRNPLSDRIGLLLEEARGKPSKLVAGDWMRKKISSLQP